MGEVTYFVALPFQRTEDGDLIAGDAIECITASRAVREAERLARLNAGAIAFSRTGDPAVAEFADAQILRQLGELPADLFEVVDEGEEFEKDDD
ncbi:hypothetical protein CWB41_15950 [Methylovirgula ligni]|uniref:Uncharacterized protein n=1 Tax=Methylovirgula ligni TaxID=569860 RepID=A0A3D9YZR8_9HYPH|nr:hypothetical protein [Methylovirgula ligni]QAY97045.1 hypothetical protein CWB41_15950 [Methylovirgula ligni]REF87885.1 hypothetical protein DES32_1520 [Methylovirgula ligni]